MQRGPETNNERFVDISMKDSFKKLVLFFHTVQYTVVERQNMKLKNIVVRKCCSLNIDYQNIVKISLFK